MHRVILAAAALVALAACGKAARESDNPKPAAEAIAEASQAAARTQGERIFKELLDEHRTRLKEERERASYAFEARSQAIGRIGLPAVREHRRKRLQQEHDARMAALDEQVQAGLERTFGGLYQACLNSADGPDRTLAVLRDETRVYLDRRLGEADLAAMVRRRFGSDAGAADGLARAYAAAAPTLAPGGMWGGQEVCVFAAPPGESGEPLRRLAVGVLPANQVQTETADEAVVLREQTAVPLTAVPHLGPAGRAAYEVADPTAHARVDVSQWTSVDAD